MAFGFGFGFPQLTPVPSGTPAPPQTFYILMEDGNKLLQEDTGKILLEAA